MRTTIVIATVLSLHAVASAQEMKKAAPATPAQPAKPATPAAPQAQPAMPMPKAPVELTDLKWMIGTWRCQGIAFANAMNPKEHKFSATAKAKMDLDNFWFTVRYEEKKTKDHAMPAKVQIFWTYDGATKKFVAAMVDNFGAWMTGSSAGWQGEKMDWTHDGMMPGMGKVQARESFTKKSDKEFTQRFEMNMGKGGWVPLGENTCKK